MYNKFRLERFVLELMRDLKEIKSFRKDALPKVTGKSVYADDKGSESTLHAYIVGSQVSHGEILGIDVSYATKLEGVEKVVTGEAIEKMYGVFMANIPVLAKDKVRYLGEPVAIVIAKSEDIAKEAAKLVRVNIKALPVVNSLQQAMKPNSELVHSSFSKYNGYKKLNGEDGTNIAIHYQVRQGDYEDLFSNCAVVVKNKVEFPISNHATMETKCNICSIDGEGYINLYCNAQSINVTQNTISKVFNIPIPKIKITTGFIGGSYGCKASRQAAVLTVLASRAVNGAEVKLTYTREDDMLVSYGHIGMMGEIAMGAKEDGTIIAIKGSLYFDVGAYVDLAPSILQVARVGCTGPYNIKNIYFDCYGICTNHVPIVSYRGFGALENSILLEGAIDKLSEELNIDPLYLRRKNALKAGDVAVDEIMLLEGHIGNLIDTIDKAKVLSSYDETKAVDEKENKIYARGVACFLEYGIVGTIYNRAIVQLKRDGTIVLNSRATEIGQGSISTLIELVSQKLKMNKEKIFYYYEINSFDEANTNVDAASRILMIHGRTLLMATDRLIEKLKKYASSILKVNIEALDVANESIFDINNPKHSISFKDISNINTIDGQIVDLIGEGYFGYTELYDLSGKNNTQGDITLGTMIAEVEVDKRDFSYKVNRLIGVVDAGKVIDYPNAYSQIVGGMNMGCSFVTGEEFQFNDLGEIENFNLRTYRIMHYNNKPKYLVGFSETPSAIGPNGARGIGEHGVFIAAAIVNALRKAIHADISELPAIPERLWKFEK